MALQLWNSLRNLRPLFLVILFCVGCFSEPASEGLPHLPGQQEAADSLPSLEAGENRGVDERESAELAPEYIQGANGVAEPLEDSSLERGDVEATVENTNGDLDAAKQPEGDTVEADLKNIQQGHGSETNDSRDTEKTETENKADALQDADHLQPKGLSDTSTLSADETMPAAQAGSQSHEGMLSALGDDDGESASLSFPKPGNMHDSEVEGLRQVNKEKEKTPIEADIERLVSV
jgi:hypothetical protein